MISRRADIEIGNEEQFLKLSLMERVDGQLNIRWTRGQAGQVVDRYRHQGSPDPDQLHLCKGLLRYAMEHAAS